jgi:hypothetical protein
MGRIFAILLMVVVIWYAVGHLSTGMGDDSPGAVSSESATASGAPGASGGPVPITQRVNDRVTAAMEERARRQDAGH